MYANQKIKQLQIVYLEEFFEWNILYFDIHFD